MAHQEGEALAAPSKLGLQPTSAAHRQTSFQRAAQFVPLISGTIRERDPYQQLLQLYRYGGTHQVLSSHGPTFSGKFVALLAHDKFPSQRLRVPEFHQFVDH